MDNQPVGLVAPTEQVKRIADTFNYFMEVINITREPAYGFCKEDMAWKLTQDAEISYIHEKKVEHDQGGGRTPKRFNPY